MCVCVGGSSWLIAAIFPSRVFPVSSMSHLSVGLMGVDADEVHSAPGSTIQCLARGGCPVEGRFCDLSLAVLITQSSFSVHDDDNVAGTLHSLAQ